MWPAVGLLLAVRLDRAGLSEPRRARQYRMAGARLFAADLGRHGRRSGARPGSGTARFSRSSSAYLPASRRPSPDREHRAPADWRCGRSGPGCWQTRPHPHRWSPLSCWCCRASSTTASLTTPEWAEAEQLADRPDAEPRGARFGRRQDHRPRGVLGGVPRRLSRGRARSMSAVAGRARRASMAQGFALTLVPIAIALSPGALPRLPADPGAVRHPARCPIRSASAGTCSAPPAIASTSPSSARASPGMPR